MAENEKKELSIEDAFKRLEEITSALENSETGLAESLELYAEGVKLVNGCKDYLQDVEKEIIMLTGQEAES